jgi:glycine betaine/proline transport system substrate-binding protein
MVSANHASLNDHSNTRSRPRSCRPRAARVKRPAAALAAALALWLAALAAHASDLSGSGEPESCKTVRFSDVGWTDVTSTTALAAQVLRSLGYTATITVLSVPVTFASLQNKDIDVFLGNWMPTQEADRSRYVADGSVVIVGPNLTGAKYTLAVPAYTYAEGLKDFSDLRHRARQ